MANKMAAVKHYNWLQLNHVWHIAFRCMRASTMTFLVKLTNASDRYLNFLSIHIRSIQTSVTMNIQKFLRILDNQRDGQNNERSKSTLAAIHYKKTAQITNLIYRQNNLSARGRFRQSTFRHFKLNQLVYFKLTCISLLHLLCLFDLLALYLPIHSEQFKTVNIQKDLKKKCNYIYIINL